MPPAFEHPLEPVAGVVWSIPMLAFALTLIPGVMRREATQQATNPDALAATDSSLIPQFRWLGLSLLVIAMLGAAPALLQIYSTERYLADAVPGAMLLAVIGSWQAMQTVPPPHRRIVAGASLGLAILTALIGLLLACNPPI